MNKYYLYDYFRSRAMGSPYVVQEGDTLYKIATMYGTTPEKLMKANNLTSTLIIPEQVLIIPKAVANEGIYFEEYVIKQNDTLDKIVSKTGVSLDEISKFNDLGKLKLAANQKLEIPMSYRVYTVTNDDTVKTILEKSKLTPMELLEINKDNWLIPGSTIYVK